MTRASGLMSVSPKVLFATSLMLVFFVAPRLAFADTYYIADGPNGGSCALIGTWNVDTATCTLTTDVTGDIHVTSPSITLDGNGHALTVDGDIFTDGVTVSGQSGVTVKNMTIHGGQIGVYFDSSDDGSAIGNTIDSTAAGIDFFNASNGHVTNNHIHGDSGAYLSTGIASSFVNQIVIDGNTLQYAGTGISLDNSWTGSVTGNNVSSVDVGIDLRGAHDGEVSGNTFAFAGTAALRLDGSNTLRMLVHDNTFSDSATGVLVLGSGGGGGPGPSVGFLPSLLSRTAMLFVGISVAYAQSPDDSIFFNNSFARNTTQAVVDPSAPVSFFKLLPDGGNTWDTYDEASEGCIDGNHDGFCDNPYIIDGFNGIVDQHPRAKPSPYQQCCSSVAFLPGFKGSILKSGSDTLWPADIFGADIPKLALTDTGESVNPVVVDGILPSFKIHIPLLGDVGPEIYSGFSSFMDTLVASSTMNIYEWKPLPYDWRYSPEFIVSHDVQTQGGAVSLVGQIEDLAAHSNTGKVTIVAHSYGGLVGKALIKALADKGESNLIDSFVMIASPQLGTPQATASLLHGDHEGIPGKTLVPNIVATRDVTRAAARNFESVYDLLPSQHYFDVVTDPVFVFDSAPFTQAWRDFWGSSINAYTSYVQFLTGTGVTRTRPGSSLVHIPEVLRSDLVTAANGFHAAYDVYSFPSNIRVVEVAGWGDETPKGIVYKNQHLVQGYEATSTIEGDGTVVYPSALASGQEDYFFNLSLFNKNESNDAEHSTLLNKKPILEAVQKVVEDQSLTGITYLSNSKPLLTENEARLKVSTHSPVILGAHDASGNFTGIYPSQDFSADLLYVQENIPGSSFDTSGDNQDLYLPQGGIYSLTYQGIGTGPTTVDITQISGDVATPVATYTDIPTTPQSSASFVVDSIAPQNINLQIDQNGDGQPDTYVAPDGGVLSLDQLLVNLTTTINNLTIKANLKTQLLNKIIAIQKKITKQRQKQSTVLASLQTQVAKQTGKKIDAATATQISTLLDGLIAQSATIPLDPTLIAQLQTQINTLPASSLKTSLLNKVTQLQNLSSITKSLAGFTKTINAKGAKGVIPDADVQNILTILDSINSAL